MLYNSGSLSGVLLSAVETIHHIAPTAGKSESSLDMLTLSSLGRVGGGGNKT